MTGRPLRIAAHLGVKDEAELIGPCIAHLRAIGVAEFIVHDIGSRDGTRDWLRREEGPGFRVIDCADDTSVAGLAQSIDGAVAACRADWMLMLDADEFPLPRGGDIRAVLDPISEDVVLMPRYNVALGPEGYRMPQPPRPGTYARIDLFTRADRNFRHKLAEEPSLTWLRAVPLPKIAVRPGAVGSFADGMHDATPKPGQTLTRRVVKDIVIAHVALSDYPRFAGKVANIRAMFDQHGGALPANFGWHWRRWAALAEAGGLRGEYDRSRLSATDLEELRAQGIIRTAADLLAEAGGAG